MSIDWQARAAALEAQMRQVSALLEAAIGKCWSAKMSRSSPEPFEFVDVDDLALLRALLSSQREPQQQPGDAAAVRRAADAMEAAIALWLDCSECGEGTGTVRIPMVCEARLEESMHAYREAVGRGAGEAAG